MLELARPSDFATVNLLAAQVHDLHVSWRPDIYCHTDELFPRDFFLEDIQKRQIFVTKLDGNVVGFLRFFLWETGGAGNVRRKVMNLENICVDANFRGQGIGKQMMLELRALAKAFGCTDIQLSVYPQNDGAVAFYQKCGFTIRNINMQTKV